MDKLFRQVSVKDRLPEKEGMVVCISADGQPFITLYNVGFAISSYAAYWLEEVELPTEEDINWKYPLNSNELHKTTLNVGCRTGANYILNTLKGEKSNG
ncbi:MULTISPECIES: hypothetical protein [Sphingobacterium]|uniref:hypothetical protein n=1 Tax=Sphingobacterium TaxID=28453 RepID=UPI00257EB846|nr:MULTISPECIES: hypothetical protein [Sphingobacterium]